LGENAGWPRLRRQLADDHQLHGHTRWGVAGEQQDILEGLEPPHPKLGSVWVRIRREVSRSEPGRGEVDHTEQGSAHAGWHTTSREGDVSLIDAQKGLAGIEAQGDLRNSQGEVAAEAIRAGIERHRLIHGHGPRQGDVERGVFQCCDPVACDGTAAGSEDRRRARGAPHAARAVVGRGGPVRKSGA
jgi:hypothetical protein